MTGSAPRSVEQYLEQLRAALAGRDKALIQDALYDAEEYLRAELANRGDKSEADALELIASTYGAPEEVAAAYVDTEVKVTEALRTPRAAAKRSILGRFFGIYGDTRAYTGLFFMLLSLVTGIVYFTFTVTGLSLSAGLAILIIGIPFFLAFIGMSRVISLAECRLVEAVSGERMPRRPVHPGPPASIKDRILDMLGDRRTWTTLAYFALMLPLGIIYFTAAVTGISIGLSFIAAPIIEVVRALGWVDPDSWLGLGGIRIGWYDGSFMRLEDAPIAFFLMFLAGVFILTTVMHFARGVARLHAKFAKALLVLP
jgi:uncharacterized membrane protein